MGPRRPAQRCTQPTNPTLPERSGMDLAESWSQRTDEAHVRVDCLSLIDGKMFQYDRSAV
jgi:hypothetical protein